MAKGEIIACFEQFLFLSLCFQKAICCRGVRKRLYEGSVNKCLLVGTKPLAFCLQFCFCFYSMNGCYHVHTVLFDFFRFYYCFFSCSGFCFIFYCLKFVYFYVLLLSVHGLPDVSCRCSCDMVC